MKSFHIANEVSSGLIRNDDSLFEPEMGDTTITVPSKQSGTGGAGAEMPPST